MTATECSKCGRKHAVPSHYVGTIYKAISDTHDSGRSCVTSGTKEAITPIKYPSPNWIMIGSIVTALVAGTLIYVNYENPTQRILYDKASQMEQQSYGYNYSSFHTIEAYKKVIQIAPDSKLSEKAQYRIDQIQNIINARMAQQRLQLDPINPQMDTKGIERKLDNIESQLQHMNVENMMNHR
jgi:hypothetical protein